MITSRRVLVSGASIAGPALAWWMQRYGWEVVVVERADELRTAGQNIDVRGAGREVVRRMGLEDAVRAAGTGELGTRFVGRDGRTRAELPAGTGDTDGATAELEILRGELARLLVEHSRDTTDYRFGTTIAALDDRENGIDVTFADGREETFDVVVAADGMRSRTRRLVVGDRARIEPKGLYTAYLTIPRGATDTDWWRWYSAPGGRSVTLRPDNLGTIRATLSFLSPPRGYEDLDDAAQRDLLWRLFADAGWETPRVLDGLRHADEYYFEQVGQVHSPTWHQGRAALVGDAAYCASPVSGMGTSLGLTGAYVLAGELASHVHHRDAFAGYERIMRPYVDQAQDLPPGTPRLANPRTRAGIAALHGVLALAATPVARSVGARLFRPPADRIDLPDYSHLECETD